FEVRTLQLPGRPFEGVFLDQRPYRRDQTWRRRRGHSNHETAPALPWRIPVPWKVRGARTAPQTGLLTAPSTTFAGRSQRAWRASRSRISCSRTSWRGGAAGAAGGGGFLSL